MKERIIKVLETLDQNHRDVESLSQELHIKDSRDFKALMKTLNEMEDEGVLVRSKHNHYFLPGQMNMIVGTLSINKKGFGFVTYDKDQEDIFISPSHIKDAFNNDEVLVEVQDKQEGIRQEGVVVRVIKRGQPKLVGEIVKGRRDYLVIPDDPKFKKQIVIDQAHSHGAMPGHKVVVEIKAYKPYLKGNVIEIIGHKSDPGTDILSIVHEHEAPIEFPDEVMEYVSAIQDEIDIDDLKNRVDLRQETIVTIDGDDAKDLDDGISLTRLSNGHYQLGVHIADVSFYVKEGSVLDKEAFNRGTSIYLVDRVIPMLPHKLSNGICSLNPHVDRYAISCMMEVDEQGDVINHEIIPTVINSTERMTYNNVNAILDGDKKLAKKYHHVLDLFFDMNDLAKILRKKRERKGAIDFDVNESKVIVDEKGKPINVVLRQRGISDHIIEEFMLLANETIAEHFKWMDLPFIYRVHEHPKTKKLQQFSTIARTLGYTIKGSLENVYPSELSAIVEKSKNTPEHDIISTLLLRCMQKARYDEQCLGHFGLADEYYTHFTSPIRRYPDLIVHRLIRKYLFEKNVNKRTVLHYGSIMPDIAERTSMCERRAIDIERAVNDMKVAEYMEERIGEEHEGIISSVTNFGIFVELSNTIEGLVHIEDLNDDYYFFDEKSLTLRGQRTGKKFKMSDKVKIKVSSASKKNKTVDFEIVGMKSNKRKSKTVIINGRKDGKRPKRNHQDSYQRNARHKRRDERKEYSNDSHYKKRKRRVKK